MVSPRCGHVCLVLSNSATPRTVATRLFNPWHFPGKNPGVGCHFLLQGIFLTQGSNPYLLHLPHWQADSLPLHHLGCPLVVHAAHVHLILIFTEYQLLTRHRGISVKKTDKNLSHCGAYVVAHVRLQFIRLQGLRQKGPGGFPDFYQIFKEVVTSILQKLRNRGGGNIF